MDEFLDDANSITDDEDNLIYEGNLNPDSYRLCKAKPTYVTVLGEIDASLAKKTLRATENPHFDTEALITVLDDVAITVDLDVSTILVEHMKDTVYGTV